jgi:hypothetical protein
LSQSRVTKKINNINILNSNRLDEEKFSKPYNTEYNIEMSLSRENAHVNATTPWGAKQRYEAARPAGGTFGRHCRSVVQLPGSGII